MTQGTEQLDGLWADFKASGSVVLRNRLAEHYLPLVHDISKPIIKRMPQEVDIHDLHQAGSIGLMQAIRSFEPERGWKFQTFASRIRGSILDYLRKKDSVPRLVRERAKRIAAAQAEFEAATGRAPTSDELRQMLKVSRQKFRLFERTRARAVTSLYRPVCEQDGEPTCEADQLIDHREPPPEQRAVVNELIGVILRDFSVTDCLFIRLYYVDGFTLKEISGMLYSMSESSMSFHHKKLIGRLRARYSPDVLLRLARRAA